MMRVLCLVTVVVGLNGTMQSQKLLRLPDPHDPMILLQAGDEKDQAYSIYKAGYSLILNEKWSDALKKLAEVKTKNPKSEYVDDAAYWMAYAQKRLDKKKGTAAYERFLADFPESSYYDDAVADMSDEPVVVVSGNATNLRVKTQAPHAYAYSYGRSSRASAQAMRETERAMREAQRELDRIGHRFPHGWGHGEQEKQLDKKTRMKLAALHALAESGNDEKAFNALKEVAVDRSQPGVLRVAAVQSLGDFRRFDVAPTLLDLAKNDPEEEVREFAIYSIADASDDKNKTVETLVTLFNGLPKQNEKQRRSILYVVADVGNDKAVDFLARIASAGEDDLANDAVYYLGNIGNDKSRSALLQILKSK